LELAAPTTRSCRTEPVRGLSLALGWGGKNILWRSRGMEGKEIITTEYVRFCFYEESEVDGKFVATYGMEDVDDCE
jgi:hypothetical protein